MVGIERRVVDQYGREYWEENKDVILSRTKARQTTVPVNSRERRRVRRMEEFEEEAALAAEREKEVVGEMSEISNRIAKLIDDAMNLLAESRSRKEAEALERELRKVDYLDVDAMWDAAETGKNWSEKEE